MHSIVHPKRFHELSSTIRWGSVRILRCLCVGMGCRQLLEVVEWGCVGL